MSYFAKVTNSFPPEVIKELLDLEAKECNIDVNYLDKCYGLLLGAGLGDNLGSFVEFTKKEQENFKVEMAMKMNGGGPHGLIPGQVTDDTELAMSCAHGIINYINNKQSQNNNENNNTNNQNENEKKKNIESTLYNESYAAKEYYNWYNSDPFDIGYCCRSTCSKYKN